jgi:SAM-dependent methyltransferase
MVELARKAQNASRKANVAWVIASADTLPFRAASFDYITSTYALRFSDLNRSLPEMRRTVRPGGRIAIRDVVIPPPRFGFWLHHCRRIIQLLPRLLPLYGWRGTWRIVVYELSPRGHAACPAVAPVGSRFVYGNFCVPFSRKEKPIFFFTRKIILGKCSRNAATCAIRQTVG